jgi:hypothetical protein
MVMCWLFGHPLLAAEACKLRMPKNLTVRWDAPKKIGCACHWKIQAKSAGVRIGDGALGLKWQVGEPRNIGLVSMPRLLVSFRFAGLSDEQRYDFMKRFDLYMHRGGG